MSGTVQVWANATKVGRVGGVVPQTTVSMTVKYKLFATNRKD